MEDSGKTNIPYVYWDYLTEGKENMMAEVYTVNEYLDMRKESIGETEKSVLKYVSFVVVAQEI